MISSPEDTNPTYQNSEKFIPAELQRCNSCTCSCIEQHDQKFHIEKCIGRYSVSNIIKKNFIDEKHVEGFVIISLMVLLLVINNIYNFDYKNNPGI